MVNSLLRKIKGCCLENHMGNHQQSPPDSTATEGMSSDQQNPEVIEDTSPEFKGAWLIHLALLLTGDEASFGNPDQDQTTQLLTNDSITCDRDAGAFVDMMQSITADSPTYTGEDPIADIKLTLQQLASCQKSSGNRSLLEKIGDFFLQKDGGKALRRLLLLAEILIECLAFWYVVSVNNMATNVPALQQFIKDSFEANEPSLQSAKNVLPSSAFAKITTWNGDVKTVVSAFSIPGAQNNKSPILLIFNQDALHQVMDQTTTENTETVLQQTSTDKSNNSLYLMTFDQDKTQAFVKSYLGSGSLDDT